MSISGRCNPFGRLAKATVVLLLASLTQLLAIFPTNVDGFQLNRNSHCNDFSRRLQGTRHTTVTGSSLSLSPADLEVIPPSYQLAIGTLALGAAFGLPNSPLKNKITPYLAGIPLLLFGLFIAFQTTTLRFTFSDSNFSLVKSDLTTTGENLVVGGENSWSYKSFVNYDFFPSRSFPILVYFKETQTPEEMWNTGPGEQANSPEAIAKGAKPGQVHFFPAIGNVEQMAKGFEKNACAKI
mmetsp:Transcript_19387/g.23099  ORF Transcript_19387/g.23099 Transcript_19387/m.23099 type:complete len:239 (-) Transcript_19387:347-1063(-)